MRITILQGAFLPVPALRGGAVEKMWLQLGREFAARGHRVTHVSRLCDDLPAMEVLAGVQHVRVRGADRPRSTWRQQWHDLAYTRRALRRAPDADVIVTNTFWAPLVARRRHGAVCVDVQRMPRGQMRWYGRAARLRANSQAVAAAIVAEVPRLGMRVRVIPNPLPFVPERAVDWSRKERTVLYAGRVHPEKGIELLLEAWEWRRRRGLLAGWTLEIVGPTGVAEGGGGESWYAALRRRFPADDIRWRGSLHDTTALQAAYERATVFAYPSLAARGETFGLAVLEAMAWGALPVVSQLACFRDFVHHGENGLVFAHESTERAAALGEAIARAAEPDRRPWAERAVRVRETHAAGAIAERFLEDFAGLR